MIASMQLTNLLYGVGAVAVAIVVSALIVLRHRRPKSLEAGIEMFSRELKALEPDGASGATVVPGPSPTGGGVPVRGSAATGAGGAMRGATVIPMPSRAGRDGARSPSPDREHEPG
jgi:hypothetical protein